MNTETKAFEGWAILELMGHRRLAGYVTEVEVAGHGMLRIDLPEIVDGDTMQGPVTQFYSPASLYALTPTTEEIARAVLGRPSPVHAWELPRPALNVGAIDRGDDGESHEEGGDSGSPGW